MSRTDLDAATLANSLRVMAGDGSVEWVMEPIQSSVLLDIANMLDDNARLRQELEAVGTAAYLYGRDDLKADNAKLLELVRDMNKWLWNGADCTECPFTAKCDLNAAFESDLHAHICIGWSEIHDRMRELGIEVDG